MDFHNAQGRAFNLVRPGGAGNLFLRRLSDGQEVTVPASSQKVELALLAFTDPRIAQRGAAHQAFSLIFSLPFDEAREGLVLTAPPPVRPATPSRRKWVLGAVGAGTVISAPRTAIKITALNGQEHGGRPNEAVEHSEHTHPDQMDGA